MAKRSSGDEVELSQASKMVLPVRIVKYFQLRLQTIFAKSPILGVSQGGPELITRFATHEYIGFDIIKLLHVHWVFKIVFGIQCNLFIVFPIRLKICRCFIFLVEEAKCAWKKNWALGFSVQSEVFCTQIRWIGIGRPISPDPYR